MTLNIFNDNNIISTELRKGSIKFPPVRQEKTREILTNLIKNNILFETKGGKFFLVPKETNPIDLAIVASAIAYATELSEVSERIGLLVSTGWNVIPDTFNFSKEMPDGSKLYLEQTEVLDQITLRLVTSNNKSYKLSTGESSFTIYCANQVYVVGSEITEKEGRL